ncbi:polysaccharide deacetylase family protein [Erythrobacter sp. SCSIO 43205]|uniref:polysaccharide deacetylase family protein n=1 Tax=Erythrobacter sp. SCSIO 43205 TaxID=2779361 RepID=UPI001CA85DC2|nr:polysaccharide deacetylase family protein [Erythrobacter sp. SCSIO 43205]UAB79717.1 polysaccharide deacetylase family protein [Erythrobacter sp. SCSIO 43205]
MIEPPAREAQADFAPDFGQRVLLTVDTEEEFDWNKPFSREAHGLNHVPALAKFQSFCERMGAHPVYLVDWPIASDASAVEIIADAVSRGAADIGVQLHPWVNPPFDEELTIRNSFAGNLPRELEAAKFTALRDKIELAFGTAPQIYRAGRYGLGPHTASILKAGGIKLDTSVRPLFDYSAQGGPDYSAHPLRPYWVDEAHTLLELPMTVMHWGALRHMGVTLQQAGGPLPKLLSALARLRMLERIALTPEGVTAAEALRGLDLAIDQGLPCIVLSFHSPSLMAGLTPYTRTQRDVETLYDWFEQIYARLAQKGVNSARVEDVWRAAKG